MNYLILILLIIFSVEIIIKLKYVSLLNSLITLSKKSMKIILNENLSDHWKERILPEYSLRMMNLSFSMLFILFLIFLPFFVIELIFDDFLDFVISLKGIMGSLLFAFCYSISIFK